MVQVDVFLSYGLSAGLVLAARHQLQKETKPFDNPYFTASLAWTALIFTPIGFYLLWAFPGWETMFVARNHADIPAWVAAAFGLTNITQGILGYYVTWRCLRAGKQLAALMQVVWSHAAALVVMVIGWDGTGFKRLTYSGTGDDWANGVELPWTGIFSSPVFYALLAMGVVFTPTYFGLLVRWWKEGRRLSSAAA